MSLRTAVCILALALLGSAAALSSAAPEPSGPPEQAVFRVVVFRQDGEDWRPRSSGTGFFTGRDGVALTNAHVVYEVAKQPDRHRLLVALDGVFFSADVVCTTRLSHDPTATQAGEIRIEKDVAQIKVKTPDVPFGQWVIRVPSGDPLVVARRHEGPLPAFTALPLAGMPRSGEVIRVMGFGDISAIPRRWSTEGTVWDHETGDDGVRIFSMRFTLPPLPGNSGSPVLNRQGQVVGLMTWYNSIVRTEAWAIAGPELRNPCR